MTLDLHAISQQIQAMISETSPEADAHRFRTLDEAWRMFDTDEVNDRLQSAKSTFLLPRPGARFKERYPLPAKTENYTVVGTDGSSIHPDRHSPARYYVQNIGLVRLDYGNEPHAAMHSEPSLMFGESELFVPDDLQRIPVNAASIGLKRTSAELLAAKSWLQDIDRPSIALQDGTLILWMLESQPEAVVDWVLPEFIETLTAFQERNLPVAAYISAPGSQELINLLRISICDYPPSGRSVNCDDCRSRIRYGHEPACDVLPHVTDQHLLRQSSNLLQGERTEVFESDSRILKRYGSPDHHICYFYLNVGHEIGRVEIPRWVADERSMLDLVHWVVFDQSQLGRGYPIVLQEAHEQAVLSFSDRRILEETIERALAQTGIVVNRTGKDGSKRVRFV